MPGNYTLELELFSLLNASVSGFEIWGDGALLGGYSSTVSSSGSTISITVPYGGALPTSLEFRFNDTVPGTPDTIEIRSVIINDRYVNTGNYLSTNILNDGGSSTVVINTSSDFLFDDSPPPGATFTTGATQTFTVGNDFYQDVSNTTPQVFDMLGGRDVAYLGTGDDTVSGGAGNDILYGGGGADLIYGDLGDDLIKGGIGNDTLFGGDGDDRIHGEDGDDEIHGGDGADRLHGHSGADIITGGAGADVISGGADNDVLFGDGGDDQIVGGAGDDTLDGGDGNDILFGGSGNDQMNGGDLDDFLIGGAGNDVMHGDDGDDTLYGQEDNDTIFGGLGADTIYGGDGLDTIDGGAGADVINGGAGVDTIDGGADNDVITGGAGADDITGGDGNDILHGHGLSLAEIRTILSANPNVTYSAETNSFYEIYLGFDPYLAAKAVANTSFINGIAGHLVNITTAYENTLVSNMYDSVGSSGGWTGGTDIAIEGQWIWEQGAEAGFNFWNGDFTGSAVGNAYTNWEPFWPASYGGPDDDALYIQSDSPEWLWNSLTTTGGFNARSIIEWDAGLINDDNAIDTLNGGAGDDMIYGYGGNDILNGDDGNDILFGGAGNDTLTGGNGTDVFVAGAGNDIINLANGDFAAGESIDGGAGTDELILTNATTVDFTTGTISNIETFTGSTGSDDITISGAALDQFTSINLGTGTNIVNITSTSTGLNGLADGSLVNVQEISASTAGADVVVSVSSQSEGFTLTGGANNDTLTGGSGVDIITGGNGDDILTGLSGDDTINGGDGNDTILGGDGNDILNGGDGNDTIYGATIIGESGVESVVQTNATTWHTVTFSAAILNPVVKMSNMTNNDGDFYSVRVRNLTETGFEWQIDEFDYLDGSRVLAEEVSWLAVAQGTHTLDNGSVIQAGTTTATNEAQTTVTFNSAFGSAPVVLTQVISDNDSAAVVSRNRNITTTNFRVNMLEEEDADGTHATEDIGWIAIEVGGSAASGFLTGRTTPTVDETVTTINFGGTFANIPVFVHDQQTTNGGDTSWSQADGVTTTTADVLIGEEQSRDTEINHPGTESVGYFALNEGLLTEAGGGDNTIRGGAGVDTLFGGDGADTFIFELLNAFVDNDILADFSAGEGDILDISDLITSGTVNVGNITNYLNFNDASGTDTIVEVDSTGGGSHSAIATINGVTGLDEVTLFTNGNIIA